MLDGIIASNVKAAVSSQHADAVAGYTDGKWPDYEQLVSTVPDVLHLPITVDSADLSAKCCDVENGDLTPEESVTWVKGKRAGGDPNPWVYCNTSTWPSVQEAFSAANEPQPFYWVAKYDEDPTIPAGAVAKQHTNTMSFDVSSLVDYIPGFDPEPVTILSDMEDDMQQIESLTNHPGEYNYGVPQGKGYSVIQFSVDGYGQQTELRVVTWDAEGCIVHPSVMCGGKTDAESDHLTVITFPNPSSTYAVSVRRLDHTAVPIGVAIR